MTTTGYMMQGMWDDDRALGWFDLSDGLYPDKDSAIVAIIDLLEYRLARRSNHKRVLAGTRIVKRTITDEVCQ